MTTPPHATPPHGSRRSWRLSAEQESIIRSALDYVLISPEWVEAVSPQLLAKTITLLQRFQEDAAA